MSWRNVIISNPAYLSLHAQRLVVKQESGETAIPLEDIGSVVVDNPQIQISVPLLVAFCEQGISLVPCDYYHLPCGIMYPFNQYSRPLQTLLLQLSAKKAFFKRLWAKIIKQKISNEAVCLDFAGINGGDHLRNLAQKVKSGDGDNRESVAASFFLNIYFQICVAEKIQDLTRL